MKKKLVTILLFFFCVVSFNAQDLSVFKKENYRDKSGRNLPYRILYPQGYDSTKSYSLILFLHGMGERGHDNEAQLFHVGKFFQEASVKDSLEAIVVLPQCAADELWVDGDAIQNYKSLKKLYSDDFYPITAPLQSVVELLTDKLLQMPQVDKERVSVMGMSMGAHATFDLLSRYPKLFFKAVAICGAGNLMQAQKYAYNTSVRIYHGSEDDIVTPDLSRLMYNRLKSLGADIKYTEYKGVYHDSWTNVFSEPDLLQWLCADKENSEIIHITECDIAYTSDTEQDNYKLERCKLDIHYPVGKKNFETVVWFHGGGLEDGEKYIPEELTNKGIAVVAVNYRLSPRVNNPAYIEDSAEALAWVFNNISSYRGNPDKIFVAGHSAGGYLALMLGYDSSYLEKYNLDANKIAGLISISGQINTHYTIRKERGLSMSLPYIDNFAPIGHARKNAPPTLLISGARELEIEARYEENAYIEAVLKSLGHNETKLYELEGFDHGNVYKPACFLILDWIKKAK